MPDELLGYRFLSRATVYRLLQPPVVVTGELLLLQAAA